MRAGLFYTNDSSAVLPAARDALANIRARGLAHKFVRHIRSSQAFALSMFAPLDNHGVRAVFERLGFLVHHVDSPVFEFEDEQDRLQEASQRSPHRTQVDVMLRGQDRGGRWIVALVEVKLSEYDFGHCSAHLNPKNPRPEVCGQDGLFGADADGCFQIQNHGYGRRRYDDYLAAVPIGVPSPVSDGGGCLVRLGRSQPMRNLALAHMLVREGEADEVVFALCAPEPHPTIWRRFSEFTDSFGRTDAVQTASLLAEDVAREQSDDGAAFFERYGPALSGNPGRTALMHLSADGGTLMGVWRRDGGTLCSHYERGDDEGARDSAAAMLDGWPWLTAVERLPARPPYGIWWESFECRPGESLTETFRRAEARLEGGGDV